MRCAVYAGTRNLYQAMVPAAKSLLYHKGADKIYLLIEDDEFPEWLPPQVETLNVSGQIWFPPNGANASSWFTYMSMIRVCLTKLFPKLDRILWLDVDTVVVDSLDELWDMDLKTNFFAMAEEKCNPYRPCGPMYYNAGVTMFNLDQIRKEKVDDQMIRMLNETEYPWVDEDVMNRVGAYGKIIDLPTRYNEAVCNGYTENPAIIHWAGFRDFENDKKAPRREYLKKYREMTWYEATDHLQEKPKPKKTASRRKGKENADSDRSSDI